MKIKFTFAKCGRGDKAKGHTKTVEIPEIDDLHGAILAEARQFLMSKDIVILMDPEKFFVYVGYQHVGGGRWKVLDEQA